MEVEHGVVGVVEASEVGGVPVVEDEGAELVVSRAHVVEGEDVAEVGLG